MNQSVLLYTSSGIAESETTRILSIIHYFSHFREKVFLLQWKVIAFAGEIAGGNIPVGRDIFGLFSGIPHERAPKGTFLTIAPGLEPVMLQQ